MTPERNEDVQGAVDLLLNPAYVNRESIQIEYSESTEDYGWQLSFELLQVVERDESLALTFWTCKGQVAFEIPEPQEGKHAPDHFIFSDEHMWLLNTCSGFANDICEALEAAGIVRWCSQCGNTGFYIGPGPSEYECDYCDTIERMATSG